MSVQWAQVPPGHRGRDYQWEGGLVRCICRCRWRSTLARTLHRAYLLWCVHIRSLAGRGQP